jgi:hypothetical protein
MPTTILASDYNTERDFINLVLGPTVAGTTPTYGYGQGTTTSGVTGTRAVATPSTASKVTAQQYQDLYIDLIRARAHQVGAAVAISEFVVGDYDANTATVDKIEAAYLAGLQTLRTNISNDRFSVDASNLRVTASPTGSSFRPGVGGVWNGSISHIFTISFPTVDDRCEFFNSGGQIRFGASVNYTGSQAKTVDWQTILNAMGTTSFKAQSTNNNAGVGTDSNIGNYNLTNAYQLLYTRDGGAVYANNEYRIYAANLSTSVITFKVQFVDGSPNDPSYGIDEVVYGDFSSTIQYATADSQITINGTQHNAVVISADPTAVNIRNLS